jgi:isopenicillin-N N-acyltransferase-like protein
MRPALAEEISGIAAGARRPETALFAVNARTELLAGGVVAGAPTRRLEAHECSVAGVASTSSGEALLAQTWDFHPALRDTRVVWLVDVPGRRWFATFTEAGIVAKTGINSDGLALCLNFLASADDGGVGGVPVHVLARCILEDCATVGDARALIDRTPRSASACITIAARTPSAAGPLTAFELAPDAWWAISPGADGSVVHTNHFVDLGAPAVVTSGREDSLARLRQLSGGARGLGVDDAGRSGLMELLSRVDEPDHPIFRVTRPDRPWLERYATLATLVYDVGDARMWLRDAMEADGAFEEVPLPPPAFAQKSPSSSSSGDGSGARIAAIQSGWDVGTPSST